MELLLLSGAGATSLLAVRVFVEKAPRLDLTCWEIYGRALDVAAGREEERRDQQRTAMPASTYSYPKDRHRGMSTRAVWHDTTLGPQPSRAERFDHVAEFRANTSGLWMDSSGPSIS